jgi:membrane protein YdbS with pleckstrin-like domain
MDETRIEMLERLAGLYRSGHLSDAEYAAEKAKLIAGAPAAASAPAPIDDEMEDEAPVAAGEEEIDRFRGSTTGWLLGSMLGWGTVLLCLAWPIALLASLGLWPERIAGFASLVGIGTIVWRYLRNIAARYVLTTQRLVMHTGIIFKRVDEIELYRVKDVKVDFSLVNQLTGIGRLTLRTSDQSSQQTDFVLADVPDAVDVRETVRMLVDKARLRRRVREVDVDEWNA